MSEIPLGSPLFAPDATRHIWTPTEIEYLHSWVVEPEPGWRLPETGEAVVKHEFKFTYRGETVYFGVVGPESTPDSQIEDNAGALAEREAIQVDERLSKRGNKLLPEQLAEQQYWDQRRDLAGAMRDMIKHAKKRAASTNGRLFYAGLK